jgi:hypothetical protein
LNLLVLLFRRFLSREILEEAKAQADKGIAGRMEAASVSGLFHFRQANVAYWHFCDMPILSTKVGYRG